MVYSLQSQSRDKGKGIIVQKTSEKNPRVRGELRTGPCLGLSADRRLKGTSKDCQRPTAAPDE